MTASRPAAGPRSAKRPSARIAYCDGARLRRALLAAADRVASERSGLDSINVFPVADGDTGTNLALTLRSVADAVRPLDHAPLHEVADVAARAGVLSARGNSGMIVSHFLLGFARHLGRRIRAGASEVAEAAFAAASALGEALETPREGTILTVAREAAASGRERARREGDLYDWLWEAREAARRSLDRTRDMLPALREAGVVDAGAMGFVEMLEGVAGLVEGGGAEEAVSLGDEGPIGPSAFAESGESGEGRYCTQLGLEGPDLPSSESLRGRLHGLGTSLIVIRTADVARVHIHADDPAAVEGALAGVGTVVSRRVEDTMKPGAEAPATAVVTDSSADLPPGWVREKGVTVVPLRVIVGERDYRDGVDLPADEVLRLLRDSTAPYPTTSQPPAADFARAYRDALDAGSEGILGIYLSSAVSGTFEAARAALREVDGERARLVDSRSGSLGLGLLVIRAVELLEEGLDPDRVVGELERVRDRSNLVFTVAKVDWLLRSGRLGRGQAWVARLMGIVPVLELDLEGNVVPRARVRGHEAAREEIFRALDEGLRGAHRYRIGVVHAGIPERAASVEEEVRRRYDPVETYCRPITAVLAAHAGPGAWGIAYQVEE